MPTSRLNPVEQRRREHHCADVAGVDFLPDSRGGASTGRAEKVVTLSFLCLTAD
jgi:hypothetical protein